jgi:hypothetical protein
MEAVILVFVVLAMFGALAALVVADSPERFEDTEPTYSPRGNW